MHIYTFYTVMKLLKWQMISTEATFLIHCLNVPNIKTVRDVDDVTPLRPITDSIRF
jgi:hypothetical protein